MDKVAEEWHKCNPGIPALIFRDQLAAHRRPDVFEHTLRLGLYLNSLPPKTSCITQPLDESPFGSLQSDKTLRNEAALMDAILSNTDSRDTFLQATYVAERRAFARPIIHDAFRRCGLWPFNPDLTQANASINLGMVETGETNVNAARAAAVTVIQDAQARLKDSRAGSASGQAVVMRTVLHSPIALLEHHRELQEEAAKEDAAKAVRQAKRARKEADGVREWESKEATRKLRRYRLCVSKVHRGGKAWTGRKCGGFLGVTPALEVSAGGLVYTIGIRYLSTRREHLPGGICVRVTRRPRLLS